MRVDFAGECRSYDGVSVEGMVEELGLADVVHFHDWMPHAEAQALIRGADLLLMIALGQPLQVPNKLFDYLGTRVPMLAVVDADGESARMLRRVGGHHLIPVSQGERVSEDALREALLNAIRWSASAPAARSAGGARRCAPRVAGQPTDGAAGRGDRRLMDAPTSVVVVGAALALLLTTWVLYPLAVAGVGSALAASCGHRRARGPRPFRSFSPLASRPPASATASRTCSPPSIMDCSR